MSGAISSKKSKSKQKTQTDPWSPTIPALTGLIGDIEDAGEGLGQLTPAQTAAFTEIKGNAARAGQFTPDIEALTRDLFDFEGQSGTVTDAYNKLQTRLGGYADGTNLDPMSDPYMRQLVDSVGEDASNRVNSMFAGAGRDLSASHVGAHGREVTKAQLPVLSDAYNRNVDRQFDASKTLYGAGNQTAQTVQALDQGALETRQGAIDTAKAAIESMNLPANIVLQIEEQMKTLPMEELGMMTQYLAQIAGLGQQSEGTQKTSSSGFSLGFKL